MKLESTKTVATGPAHQLSTRIEEPSGAIGKCTLLFAIDCSVAEPIAAVRSKQGKGTNLPATWPRFRGPHTLKASRGGLTRWSLHPSWRPGCPPEALPQLRRLVQRAL